MVNIVLTFDLHLWSLICLAFLLMSCFMFLFHFFVLFLLLGGCVCVLFLFIFGGLWFLFWLWFCSDFARFRVIWGPNHITLTLPHYCYCDAGFCFCFGFCCCFGFWLFLLGFCFGFCCHRPTRPTNKQEENTKKHVFQALEAFLGRGLANERCPNNSKKLIIFQKSLIDSLYLFSSLYLSSFCFSSLLSLSFYFYPFLIASLEILRGSFE